MRVMGLLGLASMGLASVAAAAEDLLFYDAMTYNEFKEATNVLNYTGESTSQPCRPVGRPISPDPASQRTSPPTPSGEA